MHIRKPVLSLLGILLFFSSAFAQLPSRFYAFKGDTLDGFDVKACYQEALLVSAEHHLTSHEMLGYVRHKEYKYMLSKYHVPVPTPVDERQKIINSPLAITCNNLNFENGDFTNWVAEIGYNTNSAAALTGVAAGVNTLGNNTAETVCAYHTIENNLPGPIPPADPWGGFPAVDPGGGNVAARLGGERINLNAGFCTPADPSAFDAYSSGEYIQQTFAVTAANALFSYKYAVVLDGSTHLAGEMPYFRAEVFDNTGASIPCLQYYVQSTNGVVPPGFTKAATNDAAGNPVYYTSWTANSLNLKTYIGQNVTIRFTSAGCIYGGHWGYAYVDASCSPIQVLASSPEVCIGNTLTLTAPGAGPTGTYQWSNIPGGTTAGIVGSSTSQSVVLNAPGTYEIKITQAPGCFYTIDTTIAFFPLPVETVSTTPTNCGANTGSATVNVTAGNAPYTYVWTPSGGTGPTASNLGGGTYSVTVTTTNGCTSSAGGTVATPNPPVPTLTNTPVSCFGGSDGTATASTTAGTPAYTYSWSPAPAAGTNPGVTGLTAGTYTVTVTDSKSCIGTITTTITQPPAITATSAQVNVLCKGGNNGSITVTPGGGTGPYTYAWSPAPAAGTAATAGTLTAGAYTYTVTDSKSCSTTGTATITEPPALTNTSSFVGAVCAQANGSASVVATGGTGAYTYAWAPAPGTGQGTATAGSIPAGNYTCTITDANGCTISPIVAVPNTGGPTVTAGPVKNVTCFGACNGTASVTITGGVAPLTITWAPAPGAGQGTANISALCPGTYVCTVKDANGCSSTASETITQPTALTTTTTSTNVSCFGKNDGTAATVTSGGTAPYNYNWAPAPGGGQGTANVTGLIAGTYTVTITDANGCVLTSTTTVTQPALLTISAAGVNATCNGLCNGQLICIPSGGTNPYTYSWSTGCAAASCNGICAGTYTANVTDSHGCTVSATALVGQPTPLALTMTGTPAHCSHSDGADSVFASGGTPGYTYTWKPGVGSANSSYHNIPAGSYTVVVHDSQGCADSANNTIPNLPGVNIALVSTVNVSCFGGNDGSATVAANGGFPPYTYTWSPTPFTGGGQGTVTSTTLVAGTYTCSVTDAAKCINSVTATITQPPALTVTPGPPVTICIGQCTPLTATAGGGTPAYTFAWTQNGTAITSPVCPVLTTTYTVTVTDSHGCVSPPATVTITVNPPLEVLAAGGKSICPGATDTLHATGSGGNGGPYTYNWIPATGLSNASSQNPVASPTVTTTYTVIIADNCGTPTDSDMTTVTLYVPPVVSFTVSDTIACAPMCVNFLGVSTPMCASATWIFGDGSNSGPNSASCGGSRHCYTTAGTYNVSYLVTDIHGCKGSLTIPNFINAYPRPEAAFSASPQPTTILNPDISFTDQSTGAAPLTWSWNFGDFPSANSILQNPKYTYPDTGCFNVTLVVTNSFGCTDTIMHPVCIQPDFTFYAPNTFTPNGDGKNDVWMPYGIGIDPHNYDLIMFDRWGNLMFETHTWGEGWDGRANGGTGIAQIDTYVWKVVLKDFRGNKHQYIGHCNIIK
jgi:gliding motility-associated-like protein